MRLLLLAHRTSPPIVQVAPTVTLAPSITGSLVVGATLTANAGSADGVPNPAAVLAKWLIATTLGGTYTDTGARGATYVVQAGDATKFFEQAVTWQNAAGTAIGTSAGVGPITTPVSPPSPVSPPVIS